MANNDSPVTRAQRASSLDILTFPCGQHLRPHQTTIANPTPKRQCQHQVEDPWSPERNEGNCKQDSREGQERIHHNNVDETVDSSAIVAGYGSDNESEKKRPYYDARSHEH